jgi:hypothetical protein
MFVLEYHFAMLSVLGGCVLIRHFYKIIILIPFLWSFRLN